MRHALPVAKPPAAKKAGDTFVIASLRAWGKPWGNRRQGAGGRRMPSHLVNTAARRPLAIISLPQRHPMYILFVIDFLVHISLSSGASLRVPIFELTTSRQEPRHRCDEARYHECQRDGRRLVAEQPTGDGS